MEYTAVGEVITYSFTVTNTGNVTLTDVFVNDPLPGLSSISPASVPTLTPGQQTVFTATYDITQGDLQAGQVVNTATAIGTPPVGEPVRDTDTVTVSGLQSPLISLEKTADVTEYTAVGDVITYSFTVENTGDVTLTNVFVNDPLPGLSSISPASVPTLTPGQQTVFTATYGITQADLQAGQVVNTATAIGTPPVGEPVVDDDTVTVSFNPIVQITEQSISSFMLGRANYLASNQPRLIRFLQGDPCALTVTVLEIEPEPVFDKLGGSQAYLEDPEVISPYRTATPSSGSDLNHRLTTNITRDNGSVDGCIAQGNLWAEITSAWSNDSSYTLGTVGAHHVLNPNLLVGGMVQFDRATDDRNNASGTGWMAGPYSAARMAEQPLYFEGRLLYGQTSNDISPMGTYTDRFSTERWLAQLRAEGEFQRRNVTLIPLFDLTYTQDRSQAYTDSLGNAIGSQSVALTQLTSGLDFRMPLQSSMGSLEVIGGASAIYSSAQGGSADFENGRGRVHMGLNWDSGGGTTVRAGTFYDGIGSSYRSIGGNLGVDIRF